MSAIIISVLQKLRVVSNYTVIAEQQKRRRFHPLRNLRRIFRRRTITNGIDAPTPQAASASAAATSIEPISADNSATAGNSCSSESNLRSATLASIATIAAASSSSPTSPTSPLAQQPQLDAYPTQSLPKSKSHNSGAAKLLRDVLLGSGCTQKPPKPPGPPGPPAKQAPSCSDQDYNAAAADNNRSMYSAAASMNTTVYHQLTGSYIRQPLADGGTASADSAPVNRHQHLHTQYMKQRMHLPEPLDADNSCHRIGVTTTSIHTPMGGRGRGRAAGGAAGIIAMGVGGGSLSGGEMSDSQRSLSEGRLADSEISADPLSQSQDSVFSESGTGSSLSNVLKAELADVLRKRRNRHDVSDEDLGLPRSPISPRRHMTDNYERNDSVEAISITKKQQLDTSSSSLHSLNSNEVEGDDVADANVHTTGYIDGGRLTAGRFAHLTTSSRLLTSMKKAPLPRQYGSYASAVIAEPDLDIFSTSGTNSTERLSHNAAKHKMSIKPTKRKGPSRQHRRTLETAIPEANEDSPKASTNNNSLNNNDNNMRVKSLSLPPGVNAKILEQHTDDKKSIAANTMIVKSPTKTNEPNAFTNKQVPVTATTASILSRKDETVPKKETKKKENTASTEARKEIVVNEKKKKEITTAIETKKADNTTITETKKQDNVTIDAKKKESTAIKETTTKENVIIETQKNVIAVIETKKETTTAETNENGFLRRLMQRNSKRTISKTSGGDEVDVSQSEPKKHQLTTSYRDTHLTSPNIPILDKSESLIKYEQQTEDTRKTDESKSGLSYLLSNFRLIDKPRELAAKPKSGPAARQRCVPQELTVENTSEANNLYSTVSKSTRSTISLPTKPTYQESFQSTSIIREITNSQMTNSKSDHHFEKKPKIVGLSTFQQKITRSNDAFVRSSSISSSTNSLDATAAENAYNNEQKQRKSVEKSRSFRTYTEAREPPVAVHNNMPSLPDLTLNLPLPLFREFVVIDKEYQSPSPPDPQDKSVSLGFEINDNSLVKPPRPRAESASNLQLKQNSYTNIFASGNLKSTPTDHLTPSVMLPNLSPTTSCNKNIDEIEQNIDLIVKSPFVSVLRKSAIVCDEVAALQSQQSAESVSGSDAEFELIETSTSVYNMMKNASEITLTPAMDLVWLREKSNTPNAVRHSIDATPKALERKSVPIAFNNKNNNAFKATRRSSSAIDDANSAVNSNVPEFLKIQLNRVDPARMTKSSNVVLSKNVKEKEKESDQRRNSNDEMSFKRCSNESVEITEQHSPESTKRTSGIFEAINVQAKSVSATNLHNGACAGTGSGSGSSLCAEVLFKSPPKKSFGTPPPTPSDGEEAPTMREKSKVVLEQVAAGSKLSLQERKRLFLMHDDKSKTEELRSERKKSISEDIHRKCNPRSLERADTLGTLSSQESVEKPVILRKKSFGATQTTNSLNNGNSNFINANANGNGNSNNIKTVVKDDSTPELMKVFARRSLKVKEEDINVLEDKIVGHNSHSNNATMLTPIHNGAALTKKFTASAPSAAQQNVDSDKENQSASEEKLHKSPKFELAVEQQSTHVNGNGNGGNSKSATISNCRNAMGNFCNGSSKHCNSVSNGGGHIVINNSSSMPSSAKSYLPPLRAGGLRHAAHMERSSQNNSVNVIGEVLNHNNNNNSHSNSHSHNHSHNHNHHSNHNNNCHNAFIHNNQHNSNSNSNSSNNNSNSNSNNNMCKAAIARQSLNIVATSSDAGTFGGIRNTSSRVIERSATVSEFKGIHQRRAEWEQRAKEANK